jgi:hypothetical protein
MATSEGAPQLGHKRLALLVLKWVQGPPDRDIGPLSQRQGSRPGSPRIVRPRQTFGAKLENQGVTADDEFEPLRTVLQENEPSEFVPPELLCTIKIAGGDEDGGWYVGGHKARLTCEKIVRIAVVKGQCHCARGQRTGYQTMDEICQRQGMTCAAQDMELLFKAGLGDGEAPRIDWPIPDAVIH